MKHCHLVKIFHVRKGASLAARPVALCGFFGSYAERDVPVSGCQFKPEVETVAVLMRPCGSDACPIAGAVGFLHMVGDMGGELAGGCWCCGVLSHGKSPFGFPAAPFAA